jgi:two-component system sensor histidine kinase KdpD
LAQQALLTGHPGYYRLKDGCYAAYLPLLWKDELLGVLGLVRPLAENQPGGPEVLDHPYQRRLLTIQYQLGLALNNARLTEQTRLNTGLEETSDLTSSILSAVSHELRTPLTSIKTAVSGLKDNVVALSPEEQQDYISMIDQEVDRLDKLIHQILDHSRIEAGKLQSEKGLFFLPEIVHSTVDRLGRLPLVARHPVQTEIEADLPLVYLDFIQVEEVLTNLLENAAKYSEPGTHILIRVRRMPRPFQVDAGPAQLGLLVEVIDGGMGIPESELERVFQKYYRVNSVTNGHTKTGGLGLGLAIARSLVKAHDGEIWAYLNQEKGTTFAFWLPF